MSAVRAVYEHCLRSGGVMIMLVYFPFFARRIQPTPPSLSLRRRCLPMALGDGALLFTGLNLRPAEQQSFVLGLLQAEDS